MERIWSKVGKSVIKRLSESVRQWPDTTLYLAKVRYITGVWKPRRVFITSRAYIRIINKCEVLLRGAKQWRTQEFVGGVGVSTNSVEDRGQRERGSWGGSPLVRGSGGSCNLVQEISFHIVKVS